MTTVKSLDGNAVTFGRKWALIDLRDYRVVCGDGGWKNASPFVRPLGTREGCPFSLEVARRLPRGPSPVPAGKHD